MLSRLLLLWMRPLMRRSDGLPWMVLTEEAAVMEPAVGLGCILRSARRERRGSGREKQQHYIGGRKNTSNTVVWQQRKKTETNAGQVYASQKATVPCGIKWHLKKSIIGFNVTETLQGNCFTLTDHFGLRHGESERLCGPRQPDCSWVTVRSQREAHVADPTSILAGNSWSFLNDVHEQQHHRTHADHIKDIACLWLHCCVSRPIYSVKMTIF